MPAISVALILVTLLSVQGFGFLLPGEVRMYVEMTSESPDHSVIAAIGKQNAMLGGVQGSAPSCCSSPTWSPLRFGGF